MRHTCHALQCKKHIPPRMFMCGKHWKMVPAEMRGRIWEMYVPGQERNPDLVSQDYLAVAMAAQKDVAKQEGVAA